MDETDNNNSASTCGEALGFLSMISRIQFDPMPPVLYHYCTVETFYKIISSHQLWLTNYRFMNDPLEIEWSTSLIAESINILKNDTNQIYFDTVMQQLAVQRLMQPYMFCFSKLDDSLPLWLAYGGGGSGVVLGIRTSSLQAVYDLPHCNIDPSTGTSVHQIIYGAQQQRKMIGDIITYFMNNSESAHGCASFLHRMLTMLKSSHFRWEDEWRIVNFPMLLLSNHSKIFIAGNSSTIRFHITNDSIRPHFELPLANKSIAEVIIGPRSTVALDVVSMFMISHHYNNFDIRRSNIAFR